MDGLETAILRTILYADIFSFPLTVCEIHHFLIHDSEASQECVEHVLTTSSLLAEQLETDGLYFACAGRGDIIELRHQREQFSEALWGAALNCGVWLARMPFVRMVGLTGALAMRNPGSIDDDFDYLIVTAPGRVWLARAFSVILVRLIRGLRGVVICPNYVVAETALLQSRHDLFVAHEVVQVVPLYGEQLYQEFRALNGWVFELMPNAADSFHCPGEHPIGHGWGAVKRVSERLLAGRLGDALEAWEYRRKLKRFAVDLRIPHHTAHLDQTQVKGHFKSNAHPVLQKYHERLRAYGLLEAAHQHAGD